MDYFQNKLDLEINIEKLRDTLLTIDGQISGVYSVGLIKDEFMVDLTKEISNRIKPMIKAKILEIEIELLKLQKSCIM
jgi:hypothetical protein